MTESGGPYDFVYVHTDIPEGMTIREWRAQRAVEHKTRIALERAARRARARRIMQMPLAVLRVSCRKSAHLRRRAGPVVSAGTPPRVVAALIAGVGFAM